ncbi:hypothetical protein [Erwinia persicina]|uniref:Mobilization protein n=1 Tax=Erwinia persicina TaxID=55211 RepID=A0ABR8ZX33_9GAMM|nr:hypothetical protein [Erwinia persicina]MBD8108302.1 hypothetical protein [Erwinia persicina]MBD8211291.1 hypothetical protein [Erwinia persicina]
MKKFNNIFDEDFPSLFTENTQSKKLPANRLRKHTVTVRLNDTELAQVNSLRKQLSRSSWLRDSALQQLQPIVPELNQAAWYQLTASLQKLNDLTSFLSRRGADSQPLSHEVNALKVKLSHVRDALLDLNK